MARRSGLRSLLSPRASWPRKIARFWLKGNAARLWLRGTLAGLAVALAAFFGLTEGMERWGLNTFFHIRGPHSPETPIVIISIDEDSFDELNLPWPWPRSLHAELLRIVSRGNPAVVGLDILFAEPSPYGPEDDLALGEAVEQAGNVVLAAALTVVSDAWYTKMDLNPPISPIRKGAAGFGPVNFRIDDDAFVRWAHLSRTYQGKDLPHFDLQVYRTAVRAGIPSAPFDEPSFLINYRGGPKTFTTVPYYQVLVGEVEPEIFEEKIVLVGATSPVLHDIYPTPFATQGEMPGVEIHANVLETLFQGIPLRRLPRPIMMFLALCFGVLAVRVTDRLRPLHALGSVLAVGAGFSAVGFATFAWGRLWVDVTPIPATLLLAYVATVVENFIREQREKRRLSRFFSPAVVKEIIRHKDDVNLGSSRRRMTILFSDIRGFTTLSEKMPAEEVVSFLRTYLTVMTDAVFTHGGTVDKYIGDAIMALYNVPFYQPDHAERAVRTGLEFQKRLEPLAADFRAKHGTDLRCGVGINTGEAVVGTIGSQQRLEYTAIGDTINLGSRLESLTKDFEVSMLISESTYQEVRGRFLTRYLGEVTVKGKEIPVRIYAVVEADQREDLRAPGEFPVSISDGELAILATVSDLSRGGISVRNLPKQFPDGQVVELRFDLPAVSERIDVRGKMMWGAEDKAGFRFLDLKANDREAIKKHVSWGTAPPEAGGPAKGLVR